MKTDEQKTESDLAGGEDEQRSRERARVESEKDPRGKRAPFQNHGRPAEQRDRQRSPPG